MTDDSLRGTGRGTGGLDGRSHCKTVMIRPIIVKRVGSATAEAELSLHTSSQVIQIPIKTIAMRIATAIRLLMTRHLSVF
jgi:hypothetical protein